MLYTEKELAALAVAARDTIPGYRDQSVRLIGYWGPGCDLPMPVVGSCSLSEADRARLLAYLQAPTHAREGYMGSSRCRCCGSSNGAHEVFDGRWVWPDGLAHYVEAHHVALPDDFVEHCLTTGAHPVVAPHATLRRGWLWVLQGMEPRCRSASVLRPTPEELGRSMPHSRPVYVEVTIAHGTVVESVRRLPAAAVPLGALDMEALGVPEWCIAAAEGRSDPRGVPMHAAPLDAEERLAFERLARIWTRYRVGARIADTMSGSTPSRHDLVDLAEAAMGRACGQPLSTGGHPVRHFVCLCPHSVAVLLPSGETWVCESSGSARLVEDHRFFDRVPGPGGDESRSIELAQAVFGEVVGLPPPQAGVGYIVSQMVAIACHDRRDLFFPDSGSAVRDASGQVIAVRRLLRPPLMAPHERAWG